jgi:anti-sigma factor RsiW
MKITRNVILDLLPIYVANEASSDTRALVESYLASDPEAADLAKEFAKMETAVDVPVPLNKEDAMEAYREAKRLMFRRTVIISALIAFGFLCVLGLIFVVWLGAFRLVS